MNLMRFLFYDFSRCRHSYLMSFVCKMVQWSIPVATERSCSVRKFIYLEKIWVIYLFLARTLVTYVDILLSDKLLYLILCFVSISRGPLQRIGRRWQNFSSIRIATLCANISWKDLIGSRSAITTGSHCQLLRNYLILC